MEQHAADIKTIQEKMRVFYSEKKKIRIYHGSSHSTRLSHFDQDHFIDVSHLSRVISINAEEKYAVVEPNVSMESFVEETLKYHLMPAVVTELPGITVGGAVQGGTIESSSFRFGEFSNLCFEYEIILATGEKIIATQEENADLFVGLPCSYGTLGVLTLLKVKLIPVKKFVRLRYFKINGFSDAIETIRQHITMGANLFIDGIMLSKNSGVIMVGNFSEEENLPIKTFLQSKDEWFYSDAKKLLKSKNTWEVLIPVKDYLFRYDRGTFWMGEYIIRHMKIPFCYWTRSFFSAVMTSRATYHLLNVSQVAQRGVIQDVLVPAEKVEAFLNYIEEHLNIYPVWLCPIKENREVKLSPAALIQDLIIDVGVWGKIKGNYSNYLMINKNLEKVIHKLQGRKMLYAHAYYTPEEFWQIYDEKWYRDLREKYQAAATFPDIYEKVVVKDTYNVSIFKGIIELVKMIFGGK